MSDDLIELTDKQRLSREAAAARLRELADQIARHNEISFLRDGLRFTVDIPAEVELKLEIEVGETSEIEFELTW